MVGVREQQAMHKELRAGTVIGPLFRPFELFVGAVHRGDWYDMVILFSIA